MRAFSRRHWRQAGAIGLTFFLFTGCQDQLAGHKIIARMDGVVIDADEYNKKTEQVRTEDFQQALLLASRQADPNLDAGAVALISIMRETAIDQLAKQQGLSPDADAIDKMLAYQREFDPKLDMDMKAGIASEADRQHLLRLEDEIITVGTDGAKADESELQREFATEKPQLDIQARFGLRVLGVKDESDGQQLLNQLKATGEFAKAEAQEHSPAPFDGTERFFALDTIQRGARPLYDAIQALSPGQFTSAPVTLTATGPSGPQTYTVIAQLTQKLPAKPVTLEQVRPIVMQNLLRKKYPQFQQHFLMRLTDFMQKELPGAEIYNQRKNIVFSYLLAPPPQMPVAQGSPQAAPPSGGGSPSSPGQPGP